MEGIPQELVEIIVSYLDTTDVERFNNSFPNLELNWGRIYYFKTDKYIKLEVGGYLRLLQATDVERFRIKFYTSSTSQF